MALTIEKTRRRRVLISTFNYALAAVATPEGEVRHYHTTGTGFTKRDALNKKQSN